jgi:hypothetical protein
MNHYSAMKIEARRPSEMSINFYQNTRRHIPEAATLQRTETTVFHDILPLSRHQSLHMF